MTAFLYLTSLCILLSLQSGGISAQNECLPAANCTACLLQGPKCGWCYKMDYPTSRCDLIENHETHECSMTDSSGTAQSEIYNPQASSQKLPEFNKSVRDAQEGSPAIQLSPQAVKVTITPGRKAEIPIDFRIANDYPVDLYYIMDASFSMRDDKEKISNLGESLAQGLRAKTNDVRLGFGVFVDKNVMPFVGVRPESIANPCYPAKVCFPVYGFKNLLSLTHNTSSFGVTVNSTQISGNQDAAEGGFDALLQSMACQEEIGWRENSRKLIVYSTDERSHVAGDGKLGGILDPNDGNCHLQGNEYMYSSKQDYPSVGQIASIAKRTSTTVIFAVAQKYLNDYQQIANLIPGAQVGELASDSSNIVTLVQEIYSNIITKVQLGTIDLTDSDGVEVRFRADCDSQEFDLNSASWADSDQCNSVGIARLVHFTAEISAPTCTHSFTKKFIIKPQDLADKLEVTAEIDCECVCADKEESSSLCSGAGSYECGGCACNEGYTGDTCECSNVNATSTALAKMCNNPLSGLSCSGNGDCTTCGKCKCDCLPQQSGRECQRFTGDFCECNPAACDFHDGQICAGRGKCECSATGIASCNCDEGFTGNACQCPISTDICKSNNRTGEVCNGKGDCICGTCTCTNPCYTGPTCEILAPECSRTCINFKECVLCELKLAGGVSCDEKVCPKMVKVDKVQDSSNANENCEHRASDSGCTYKYKYNYNNADKTFVVTLQKEPECEKDYWLEWVIGIVIAIFLIGLIALIVWKVVVTQYDKRDYARFEKEQLKAKWETTDNPIYKPATTKFKNPTYAGNASTEEFSYL